MAGNPFGAQIPPGKLNLTDDLLVDTDGKKANQFVCKFFSEHGQLPTLATVEKECEVPITAIDASEPLEYYLGQIRKRRKFNQVGTLIKWASDSLGHDQDADKVIDKMRETIRDADKAEGGKLWNAEEQPDRRQILDDYETIEKFKGKTVGIETPWEFINETTGGILPGYFVSVISHSSVGKTWMLVKLSEYAHKQKKVLFISRKYQRPCRIALGENHGKPDPL